MSRGVDASMIGIFTVPRQAGISEMQWFSRDKKPSEKVISPIIPDPSKRSGELLEFLGSGRIASVRDRNVRDG